MLPEQPAEAVDRVADAARAERVPIGDGVDREDRLLEPALRLGGDAAHWQVGAELDDRVDVGPVERLAGADQLALAGLADLDRSGAGEVDGARHRDAEGGE